jgi:hypothetical protein
MSAAWGDSSAAMASASSLHPEQQRLRDSYRDIYAR